MPPTSVRNEARSTPWPAGRKAGGLSSNLSLYFPLGLLLVPPFGETHAEVRGRTTVILVTGGIGMIAGQTHCDAS